MAMLGHKADLGVMALGPDLARLQAFQAELLGAPLEPVWSYVSLTELSEYGATEDEERARLVVGGAPRPATSSSSGSRRGASASSTTASSASIRTCPPKQVCCFYPMSKRRAPDANWYELSFAQRKELMAGHARVGRTYAGRVLQLITGSTGIDDWEWGVTLLADDIVALKEIVYEMRFDPVSATLRRLRSRSSPVWCFPRPTRARGSDCVRPMTPRPRSACSSPSPKSSSNRPMIYEHREALRRRPEHPARPTSNRTQGG